MRWGKANKVVFSGVMGLKWPLSATEAPFNYSGPIVVPKIGPAI